MDVLVIGGGGREHAIIKKIKENSIQEQADDFAAMEPKKAAAILSEMPSDIDLICELLGCMKKGDQSAILEEMEDLFAARIANRIHELGLEDLE